MSSTSNVPFTRMYQIITWDENENLENYRIGGFHPVHLGDRFKNDRYEVLRKLGFGSYSTVWLSKDLLLNRYVALKINGAVNHSDEDEITKTEKLLTIKDNSPGRDCCMIPLDTFRHAGPNGVHACLIFEVMDGSLNKYRRYRPDLVKYIAQRTLLGISHLHRNNLVHSDLHTGNVFFRLRDVNSLAKDDFEKRYPEQQKVTLERLDGSKVDSHAPRYIVLNQPCQEKDNEQDIGEWYRDPIHCLGKPYEVDIRIGDLGSAFIATAPPQSFCTPFGLQAPEQALGLTSIDAKIDIWTFGCMIFQLLFGYSPVPVDPISGQKSPDEEQQDIVLGLVYLLGSIPEQLLAQCHNANTLLQNSDISVRREDSLHSIIEEGKLASTAPAPCTSHVLNMFYPEIGSISAKLCRIFYNMNLTSAERTDVIFEAAVVDFLLIIHYHRLKTHVLDTSQLNLKHM
ncbi:uncharacterized protein DFL_006525 [Arthrobotrys flagrans]|uniref:non-specific serine/threonine protein kinase n=1 Tax=Arthrobotrys flagrans TaxID=97331 RepID=A0A437A165_ARTFL|nr:hypothetical protein DFL_006525 [Arthrobotrys flagrans]